MSTDRIWVLGETRDGSLTRATRQLVTAARQLAGDGDWEPVGLLPGGPEKAAEELAELGLPVWRLEAPGLTPYEATAHLAALGQLVADRGRPAVVLGPASCMGLELLPRLAAATGGAYASACVETRLEGAQLVVRRPTHGGRAYEELLLAVAPAVVAVRPGAYPAATPADAPGEVENLPVTLDPPAVRVVEQQVTTGRLGKLSITEASRVVTGGRGLGSPERFALLEELATLVDGAVGATRSVVDAGWRPHDEQVGKSGATIAPELYMAFGVSGAIHHVLGMNTAQVVVAVNTDPKAPIFEHADHGIVGDAEQVLQALLESLRGS